jgi:hypothetical protein
MISFEEKIRELVALMPPLVIESGSYPIRYDWGTVDVLNKFLILKENVSKYPLIWLVTGSREEDRIFKTIFSKARFIIATRAGNVDEFNSYQYQNDYLKVLIPVYDNFIKLLERSSISTILSDKHESEIIPNYSLNKDDKGLITVWNALVIDIELEIDNERCLKTIKF